MKDNKEIKTRDEMELTFKTKELFEHVDEYVSDYVTDMKNGKASTQFEEYEEFLLFNSQDFEGDQILKEIKISDLVGFKIKFIQK